MRTDSDLLQCWAQFQDQAAFTEVVRRYSGLVMATALRRCSHRRDLADEVSQRVFAAVAGKASKLVSVPRLSAWLHRATVLECTHLARREAIYSKKLATLANQPELMHPSANTTAHGSDGLLAALDETLLRLRERDREILMLRHVQGMSYREIATALGKNEAAVQRHGSRALEALASRMKTRYATITAVAVGAQLSHGLALAPDPVAVETLSALARKLAAATGSAGTVALWLASISRAKMRLAGTAMLSIIGIGVYLWMTSGTHGDATVGNSQVSLTARESELSGTSETHASGGETKVEQPLTDAERERQIAAERFLTANLAKNVYQVHQALFAYASGHDQKFPNPKDRNANAAFRELFRIGLIDDEKLFAMVGTNTKADGDIGSKLDDFAKTLGPNENSISYVAGLTSDRDDATLPILRADYQGKSGVHYVIVARLGGLTKVYETTNGIVLEKKYGQDVDIFSKAYGTAPENILSPVITDAVIDKDWEKMLDLVVHDPEAARERCLQPQEGKDVPPWLLNAASLAFGNMPLENFEQLVLSAQVLPNERQREVLQRAAMEARLKLEYAAQTAAWLETLPPDSVSNLVRYVAPKFAAEDPRAAADWYVKLGTRTLLNQADVLRQAISLWSYKRDDRWEGDWAAASEWLLLQNQAHADQAKGALAQEWFNVGEPEAALRWAESINEPICRKKTVQGLEKKIADQKQ